MSKTLCKHIKERALEKDLDAYAQLVYKAKFVCTNCGRAARKEKHLCKPLEIKAPEE